MGDGQGWLLIDRIGDDGLILMLVRTEACLANESSAAVWENCTAVFLFWSKLRVLPRGGSLEGHLFYFRSINPMTEKINPTIPIPRTSSPIPDEQREIMIAKSSIAIPNPIFFIVNPPLQIKICHWLYCTMIICYEE